MSSPSWHSVTVVKLGSSAGDTRGVAGGGEQLPQQSPPAGPSMRFSASRAKPGWGGLQTLRDLRCLADGEGGGSTIQAGEHPCLTSVLSSLVQSVHALRRLPYPTSFLVSLSLSLPVPPRCQALERSRINVSFDYGGCMGDVRQAWQSPLMSWHTGLLVHLDRNIQRAHRWPVVVLLADV